MNDPRAQDVVRCTLCVFSMAPMYCEVCRVHLCKDCVEKHFSDSSKQHNVVSLKQFWKSQKEPMCKVHSAKQCELFCEECDIPVCTRCILGEHLGHKLSHISITIDCKRDKIQTDLQELENIIHPHYQQIASTIPAQKADLNENSEELTKALDKQGEIWHREIDSIIKNIKSNLVEMNLKHLDVLNKRETKVANTISEIVNTIAELKKLLGSRNVGLVSGYKSRIAEFRSVPSKLKVSLPKFTPREINRDQLIEQFGSLSALTFTTEEDYIMPTPEALSSSPEKLLLDEPKLITTINANLLHIYGVACLNDFKVWISYVDNKVGLLGLDGKRHKSIYTGCIPSDIAVSIHGDLFYTNTENKSVNVVKNTDKVQTVIKLQKWEPCKICSTSSGDLLVFMKSDDKKQTKIVRYTGAIEKRSIQFDEKHKMHSGEPLSIDENRNLDVCVVFGSARNAVFVVDQTGKLRFTYTGCPSKTKKSFDPRGITTDSQSRILVADYKNHLIHILDQDGQFLRFIDNCQLNTPRGLCVDSKDNLFVTEFLPGKVKKIQYYL